MQDGLEVWPGTSGCYTGFDWNLRIYCPAASRSSIGFTPSLLVVWESRTSTARQHRTVYVRPYPSHPQRWSGWISWGLISKLASHRLLGETFSSLRYQSSSSNKQFLCGNKNLKLESFLCRVLVPCKMLWTCCNTDAITSQSKVDAGPNLPFSKILQATRMQKENHKISKEMFCRFILESSAWGEKCLGIVCWKYGPFNPKS